MALPSTFIANIFGRSCIVSAADFNDGNEALVENDSLAERKDDSFGPL